MGTSFWIRRFSLVFAAAVVIIAGAQFAKGHTLRYAVTQGLLWGAISSAIYLGALFYRIRKSRQCAICPAPATPTPAARSKPGA